MTLKSVGCSFEFFNEFLESEFSINVPEYFKSYESEGSLESRL